MFANQRSIKNLKIFTDLCVLNGSYILAGGLAQSFELLYQTKTLWALLLILNVVWIMGSNVFRFYDEFTGKNYLRQIINLFRNTVIQIFVAILFIFLVKELLFTRYFIAYYAVLLFILLFLKQIILRKTIKYFRRKGKYTRRLMIIGRSEIGIHFLQELKKNSDLTYEFKGFVDDEAGENDIDFLGTPVELEKIIHRNNISDAVIALPMEKFGMLGPITRTLDINAVKTFVIPDYFNYLSNKFEFNLFGNLPILTLRSNPLDEAQWRFVKRSFDIIFSALMIVFVIWWLFPVIAIIIKSGSRGPVFFLQERYGLNNSIFKCYKFRTMTESASKRKNEMKAVTLGDSRVTKIGYYLRKYNLDELPQFFNILKGEMSVVGPRPHTIIFNDTYQGYVEEIKLRHRVKPGLTGWAQIHGLRGDVPDFEENKKRTIQRIEHDIWYIENWNFWLDIQIIIDTVMQVIRRKNTGY